MKLDLHVHTYFSPDACVPLNKDLIYFLKKRGIQGIAITDHNTFKGVIKAKKFLEKNGILVISGEEVRTEYGELLCLFLNEEIQPSGLKKYPFDLVKDQVKDQDGLVGLSHPFDFMRSNWIRKMQIDWVKENVNLIEAYNARCNLHSMNTKAYNFCINNKIPLTAGSDAHFLLEIGRGCLLFDHAESVEEVRRQVMSNKASIIGLDNIIPLLNSSSFIFHVLTTLARFFWPIGQYLST